jgi:putative DNA methylase
MPDTHVRSRKKLIEVALPLEAINRESLHRKQKAPKGWPTSFHKWWAQRPLAAARAVIFAQMVDDPSSLPDLFPTELKQQKERARLFRIIEDLVLWENTNNEEVFERAQAEIWQSWRRACADNADHPEAKTLFQRSEIPAFADPFAGSGSLPLSAQWLGLKAYASDLNPVAVLINKALLEIPPYFAGRPPVNPEARQEKGLIDREWKAAQGLANDVRYYGKWMRDEAEKRIGHLYPKIEVTADVAKTRPDLKPYVGQRLPVVAWIWARTVKSPNPAFAKVDVPLASTFILSTKAGKESYIEPVVDNDGYRFIVRAGKPKDAEQAKSGTKLSRGANFRCLMSGTPISADYMMSEGKAGRMGTRLMAVVAEGSRGRVYLSPTPEHERAAVLARPDETPDLEFFQQALGFRVGNYGFSRWSDLFTPRQLIALCTFCDLVQQAREKVEYEAKTAGHTEDVRSLRDGGKGSTAYAEAVSVYLACVVDRIAYYGSTLVGWLPKDGALGPSMPRQVVAMTWDFAEANCLGKSSGDVMTCSSVVANYLDIATPFTSCEAFQGDAQEGTFEDRKLVISTDPPYYDNVGYADLSDFFYIWLRRALRSVFPDLFSTVAVPKAAELVATPGRHGGSKGAEEFFIDGMMTVMRHLAKQTHPTFPMTIYYAFKQVEDEGDAGTASTGWETFLSAVVAAGFSVTGTWPLRTEGEGRMRGRGSNALASSIVLGCRARSPEAPTATRRELVAAMKAELPNAITHLQRSNIAPVDLAQAAIGPGMAVYTRFAKVIDAEGKSVSVREALALINQVLDDMLAAQEGELDPDSRFALAWFEQNGFAEGEFGVAETLSKAKNTSVSGLADAGILASKRGKVRLLKPNELPKDWDPATDARLTNWETVHHLIRVLEGGGESAAATLVPKLGSKAETARELAYRLYTVCERKKRASEALSYNGLVQSWPEIMRLARETSATVAAAKPELLV